MGILISFCGVVVSVVIVLISANAYSFVYMTNKHSILFNDGKGSLVQIHDYILCISLSKKLIVTQYILACIFILIVRFTNDLCAYDLFVRMCLMHYSISINTL